jgi:hypothetical protein
MLPSLGKSQFIIRKTLEENLKRWNKDVLKRWKKNASCKPFRRDRKSIAV